jgi:hypothetical protein
MWFPATSNSRCITGFGQNKGKTIYSKGKKGKVVPVRAIKAYRGAEVQLHSL